MAVSSVELHWTGATGSHKRGDKREYTAVYKVLTDDALDQASTIIDFFAASGTWPYINDPYEYGNDSDALAFCDSITPDRDDGHATLWQVTHHFATPDDDDEQGEDSDGNPTNNPLDFRDELDIGKTSKGVAVEKAINLTAFPNRPINTEGPVTNSAGVVLKPPLEETKPILTFRFTRYQQNYPGSFGAGPNNLGNFIGAINVDEVTFNRPALNFQFFANNYTLLCKSVNGTFRTSNNVDHWKLTYELWYDPDTWIRDVLDQGIHRKADAGDPDGRGGTISLADQKNGVPLIARILDPNGLPINAPILLNGQGQPLAPGANPVYIKYRTRYAWIFGLLNLHNDP